MRGEDKADNRKRQEKIKEARSKARSIKMKTEKQGEPEGGGSIKGKRK
jgi:hypothetical protein